MALIFCLLASIFYATEIVVSEKHFAKIPPEVTTCLVALGIFLFSLPRAVSNWHKIDLAHTPSSVWFFFLFIGFLSYLGDWSHFSALHQNAGSVVLSMFYMLLPVICSLLKWQLPSWKLSCAWIFSAFALYLVKDEFFGG